MLFCALKSEMKICLETHIFWDKLPTKLVSVLTVCSVFHSDVTVLYSCFSLCLSPQVQALRSGFRSIPLKNGYSEDLELATLLVHLSITYVQVSNAFSCRLHRMLL